jgi:hypothetical protein
MSIRDEIAASINGNQYRAEVSKEIEVQAKAAGVVIVFGASDDLMEFRGAISDEVGAYDGGTGYVTREGLLQNECEDEDCPHFNKIKQATAKIEAFWDDNVSGDDFTWTYKTAIPHATFEIFDEGDKYCRGIVFNLADCVPA